MPEALLGAVAVAADGPEPYVHRHHALDHGVPLVREIDGQAEAVNQVGIHGDDDDAADAVGQVRAPPLAPVLRVGAEEDDFVAGGAVPAWHQAPVEHARLPDVPRDGVVERTRDPTASRQMWSIVCP